MNGADAAANVSCGDDWKAPSTTGLLLCSSSGECCPAASVTAASESVAGSAALHTKPGRTPLPSLGEGVASATTATFAVEASAAPAACGVGRTAAAPALLLSCAAAFSTGTGTGAGAGGGEDDEEEDDGGDGGLLGNNVTRDATAAPIDDAARRHGYHQSGRR
mmetsp:Transcript_139117/g.444373  ORF Transcript_139117/g.444373 Transcript_139117/m.444373 type:complete len:163 (-) Transcript_139117:203-691(-)